MKNIFLALLVLVLVGCENREQMCLTKEEVMVLFQNGYLSGQINALRSEDNQGRDKRWQIDSTEFSQSLFQYYRK